MKKFKTNTNKRTNNNAKLSKTTKVVKQSNKSIKIRNGNCSSVKVKRLSILDSVKKQPKKLNKADSTSGKNNLKPMVTNNNCKTKIKSSFIGDDLNMIKKDQEKDMLMRNKITNINESYKKVILNENKNINNENNMIVIAAMNNEAIVKTKPINIVSKTTIKSPSTLFKLTANTNSIKTTTNSNDDFIKNKLFKNFAVSSPKSRDATSVFSNGAALAANPTLSKLLKPSSEASLTATSTTATTSLTPITKLTSTLQTPLTRLSSTIEPLTKLNVAVKHTSSSSTIANLLRKPLDSNTVIGYDNAPSTSSQASSSTRENYVNHVINNQPLVSLSKFSSTTSNTSASTTLPTESSSASSSTAPPKPIINNFFQYYTQKQEPKLLNPAISNLNQNELTSARKSFMPNDRPKMTLNIPSTSSLAPGSAYQNFINRHKQQSFTSQSNLNMNKSYIKHAMSTTSRGVSSNNDDVIEIIDLTEDDENDTSKSSSNRIVKNDLNNLFKSGCNLKVDC